MNKNIVKIVVEAKSSFGVKDKLSGKWFNPTKKAAGSILPLFNIGTEYDVEIEDTKGKDGKLYTNIVAIVSDKPAVKTPLVTGPKNIIVDKPASVTAINKDERILVQGLTQALLQSPVMSMVDSKSLVSFVETNVVALVEMVKKLAK